MSRSETKRRKVWVTFDGYGLGAAYTNKAAAMERIRWSSRLKDPNEHEVAVPMVELRRGDVVLSREDAEELRDAASAGGGAYMARMLYLLRGGR